MGKMNDERGERVELHDSLRRHPGAVIRDCLDDQDCDVTAVELARLLRVSRSTLYRVLRGAHPVTAVLALRLEALGWSTARQWLRLQAAYDLAEAKRSEAA